MLFSRISSLLRSSQILLTKTTAGYNVPKCDCYSTVGSSSEKYNLPKKPVTPYLRFFHSILPELNAKFPDCSYREKVLISKRLWESLELFDKKQIIQSFYDDLDNYKMARLRYECRMNDEPEREEKQPTIVTKKEKRKLKKLRKVSGRPKKPPSAFLLFLQSKRGTFPKSIATNWISHVTLEYMNLNENEKAKFQGEAKKLNEEYKKSISEWEDKLIKEGQIDIMYKRSKFSKTTK